MRRWGGWIGAGGVATTPQASGGVRGAAHRSCCPVTLRTAEDWGGLEGVLRVGRVGGGRLWGWGGWCRLVVGQYTHTYALDVFLVRGGAVHVRLLCAWGQSVMWWGGGGRVDGRSDKEDGRMRRDGTAQVPCKCADLEGGFRKTVNMSARGRKETQF